MSEDSGVVWKLDTSLKGWSSPAVWGDRAYMTEAANDGSQMYAFAVDLKTGKVAWRQLLFTHEKVFEIHLMNSYASPSPCTDGKYVWVNFGSYGSACLQAENGEVVWKRNDFLVSIIADLVARRCWIANKGCSSILTALIINTSSPSMRSREKPFGSKIVTSNMAPIMATK